MHARAATSSRRRPGVRRRAPAGRPTSAGRTRSRRSRRNRASSCLAASATGRLRKPCTSCAWMRRCAAGTLKVMDKSIALVTGANKGIGKEIARQLAAAGHTVYVGSRDAVRGKDAVADIGGDTRLLVLDVADAESVAAAARQVPALDILVNNAGISPSEG